MRLIELNCKGCGGNLTVKKGDETVTCPYCNKTYAIDEYTEDEKKQF